MMTNVRKHTVGAFVHEYHNIVIWLYKYSMFVLQGAPNTNGFGLKYTEIIQMGIIGAAPYINTIIQVCAYKRMLQCG